MASLRTCVVIPARMDSVRLPGKMLLRETGRSLIEHTHAVALRAQTPEAVIVATDHSAIADEVRRFGGVAVMTSPDCQSGADRVAEVASRLPQYDLFVNLQGDEPELDPAAIDRLVAQFDVDAATPMATLAAPLEDPELLHDPNVVKVVFDSTGRAMYFSRSPIPFVRDAVSATAVGRAPLFHQHIGIYAYRRDFLTQLPQLAPSPLEQAEKLEQLRVLQAGHTIRVGVIPHAASGIDTAADYAAFVRRHCRAEAA
ncbi:3-deoxy-manno-octulosonate cytidylyltransferase [Botrimarina colliarenosi]|uniref:3-deoxy-manno-octulosonate cytidylyltransferase n=1 Tax=Botrimarina colliarenosi TaxID=2528001 RepID=A0A5C6ANN6_9BACT|nr:3-deoxy-manno-octulosonate cytidylyltransferase [Botrimarina colliarenosi]TWT99783.1 3-deoxy-manno-octulosonate cytidylyltransferase [Botrimarina colliarenosi]